MNESQVRQDQQAYHRAASNRSFGKKPVKPTPKGHEAFLKALEQSAVNVEFEKASSGEKLVGKIKTSDKYTISVAVPYNDGTERYTTRVLFKHDVSEFTPLIVPSVEVQ